MPNTAISQVVQGVAFTVNPTGYPDGAIMLSSSAAPTGGIDYLVNSGFKLPAGKYYILPNNYPSTGMNSRISVGVKNGPQLAYDGNFDHTHRSFTLAQKTEIVYRIYANKDGSIGALDNVVIYPMISRIDGTVYYPYAMTNRELTESRLKSVEIDIGGTTLSNQENGLYFAAVDFSASLPSGAVPVSLSLNKNAWSVALYVLQDTRLRIMSPQSFTLPTGRKVTIFYYIP